MSKSESNKPNAARKRLSLDDLRETPRLLERYRKAVEAGKVRDSESELLEFVSLAEHALASSLDAPALFARLLALGARARITLADEDRARDRLRAWRDLLDRSVDTAVAAVLDDLVPAMELA